MFVDFFYLLRSRGLKISLNEWMTLLLGMEKGLHRSSLTGFISFAGRCSSRRRRILTASTRCF